MLVKKPATAEKAEFAVTYEDISTSADRQQLGSFWHMKLPYPALNRDGAVIAQGGAYREDQAKLVGVPRGSQTRGPPRGKRSAQQQLCEGVKHRHPDGPGPQACSKGR